MKLLDRTIALLDGATALFGRLISWLVLYMVLVTFANVVLRYVYGYSNVALIESVLYAFGIVLTAVGGWTLLRDEHVRIDVFYASYGPRTKAVVNMLGTVFLLAPVLWVLGTRAFPYVERSWKLRETSNEVAGLDYLYVFKTFILVFVAVLAVQGLSFFLRNLRTLIRGREPDARAPEPPRAQA